MRFSITGSSIPGNLKCEKYAARARAREAKAALLESPKAWRAWSSWYSASMTSTLKGL